MSKDVKLRNLFLHDYSPTEPYLPYKDTNDRRGQVPHWGHAKLFLEEVLFLTLFVSKHPSVKWVLYIGSAPFYHGHILSQMFPHLQFVLYDPRSFVIPQAFRHRFEIHQQYFTDVDAKEWASRGAQTAVISDIRSIKVEKNATDEEKRAHFEQAVRRDMALQMGWVKIINPASASLKFRMPFPELNPATGKHDIDEMFEYLDGYIMLQPFRGSSSTETRLIPVKSNGEYVMKRYSSVHYQDQNHYHNLRVRPSLFHNPFTGDFSNILDKELINDFDSVFAAIILAGYLEMCTGKKPSQDDVNALYKVFLNGSNEVFKDPITLERVRASTFKSTVMKGPMQGKQLRDVLAPVVHTYRPYTRISADNASLVAPTPIPILV
jgi:hypothetical protein